jgi:hypothetical protein
LILRAAHDARLRQTLTPMSRSRRKTPIVGLANSASEKDDKVIAHRRARHAAKIAVAAAHRNGDAEAVERDHPRSGQWTFGKDGKRWIGRRDPTLMRK